MCQAGTYKQRERTDAHRSCILRSTHPARRMLQAILAQYRTLHTPVIWTCAQVFQRLHIMHRQHRCMHSHRKVDQSSSLGRLVPKILHDFQHLHGFLLPLILVFQRLHIMHRQHKCMHSHRKVDQSSSLGRLVPKILHDFQHLHGFLLPLILILL